MKKKYTARELSENRQRYFESRTGDLTSYAALIGETFATKINLLAQLIRDAHHPSLGLYKERLLREVISKFIPRAYDVGTGFVIFPKERQFDGNLPQAYDVLNSADHVVSRQCDIIVFDSSQFPVVFREGDFVVVRPEAVRSIVEVKGSLSSHDVKDFVEHFIDFGRKWRACRKFYSEKYQSTQLTDPRLFVMAWQVAVDAAGRPRTDGTRIRKRIVELYSSDVKKEELDRFPILEAVYVYNDVEVVSTTWGGGGPVDELSYGFATNSGRFVRFRDDGTPVEAGDSTIASLLARIHYSLDVPFNRFFSYARQTHYTNLFPHRHAGYTRWLLENELHFLGWNSREEAQE